jgi:hypothetical protein
MNTKPSYRVLELDLTTLRDRTQVLTPGQAYTAVSVRRCPGGAGLELSFGSNADLDEAVEGDTYQFLDKCGHPLPCDDGLYVTNPAGAGTVRLLVSFAGTGGGSVTP